MMLPAVETILSVLVGLSLAAAAGFRVFVPLLAVGFAHRFGVLPLSEGFQWMSADAALWTFGAATVLEVLAYFVPWIDNLLDTVATPAAIVAGVMLTAAVIVDLDPTLRWSLAIIAGGGTATVFQGLTAGTRGISSLTTGGLGNPGVSTLEAGGSVLLSVLAVLVPIAAVVCLVILLAIALRLALGRRRHQAAA
ncbi:MAG TPA: DUF4126 domain-containing protein [Thermoanaerobaculia bacterium]|nr:DUF4126 domain-containing protein [Thermoanaerobaculia bacterium]